jgi:RimJ/RimL family protein N-acetyltransferase
VKNRRADAGHPHPAWPLEQLKADVTVKNAASGRVLEKCGFVPGRRHAQLAFVNGEWIGGYQYVRALAPNT